MDYNAGMNINLFKEGVHIQGMDKFIFLDTETTGFNPGSICQLSYIIFDGENAIGKNYFFAVDYIEQDAEMVHGFSKEKLRVLSKNKRFKDHAKKIKIDFDSASCIVGHNINFDMKFLSAEFNRCGLRLNNRNTFCTMKYFKDICKIPEYNSKRKGYKWPKLEEIVEFLHISPKQILDETRLLFSCGDVDFHDARFDATATYLCFRKGVNYP